MEVAKIHNYQIVFNIQEDFKVQLVWFANLDIIIYKEIVTNVMDVRFVHSFFYVRLNVRKDIIDLTLHVYKARKFYPYL